MLLHCQDKEWKHQKMSSGTYLRIVEKKLTKPQIKLYIAIWRYEDYRRCDEIIYTSYEGTV